MEATATLPTVQSRTRQKSRNRIPSAIEIRQNRDRNVSWHNSLQEFRHVLLPLKGCEFPATSEFATATRSVSEGPRVDSREIVSCQESWVPR
jgi:hypothetical protein